MTEGHYKGYVVEYKSTELSKPISCLGNICAIDSVVTVDRTNGTVKQVFPNGIDEAKREIELWRKDYNEQRPHRSLKMKTPNEFANEYKTMLSS